MLRGPNGCWAWKAYRDRNGYGWVTIGGKKQAAHRVAYELATGEKFGDLFIDHKCRNSCCVNPAHLRPATHKQNMENQPNARRNSATGVRGVYFNSGSYQAKVQHRGKVYLAGRYATVEEADAAVRAKRLELFTHNEDDRGI